MEVLLESLAEVVNGRVVGDATCVISSVGDLGAAKKGDITFLANKKFSHLLPNTKASAVILKECDVDACRVHAIVVNDPYLAYAQIATVLTQADNLPGGIHPTATISKSATIDTTAYIGPNVVVEDNVSIAANVVIVANCFIGRSSVIGESVFINANVSIYADTEIAENCIIHSGAVIGADGFGYAPNKGEWVKIPQLGAVIIGKNVEIGANTTIDRGAISNTIIGDGVKIDNLVHIAHNVEIGEHTAMAAFVGIAGSTKIGAHCTLGGAAGINGHIEIVDNVHLGGMAMVTKSLMSAGAYASGIPAEPSEKWRKNVVRFRQFGKLEERIKSLEVELKALKGL